MTPSADLRRSIRDALAKIGMRPARTAGHPAAPARDVNDPPRDPDWAVREIVDDVLFERLT